MRVYIILLTFLVTPFLFGKPPVKVIEKKCSVDRGSKIIEKNLKHFHKCFELLSDEDYDSDNIDLSLNWDIDENGSPIESLFEENTSFRSQKVKECIKETLFKLRFPKYNKKGHYTCRTVYKFNYKRPKKVIVNNKRDHKRVIVSPKERERREEIRDKKAEKREERREDRREERKEERKEKKKEKKENRKDLIKNK
ncbi:hypothetical protein JXR93_12500 [bacterium]|nr:hypothetical protein [bacterium]